MHVFEWCGSGNSVYLRVRARCGSNDGGARVRLGAHVVAVRVVLSVFVCVCVCVCVRARACVKHMKLMSL